MSAEIIASIKTKMETSYGTEEDMVTSILKVSDVVLANLAKETLAEKAKEFMGGLTVEELQYIVSAGAGGDAVSLKSIANEVIAEAEPE